jgi:hypothetical protein
MKRFGFIVIADSYAGNFEREMCAYMTGHIGECGVGDEYVEKAIADQFGGYIESLSDDNGCCRPVSMLVADNYFETNFPQKDKLNSLVIYFYADLTKNPELVELMKKRAYEFPALRQANKQSWDTGDKMFNVLGFAIVRSETITTVTNLSESDGLV